MEVHKDSQFAESNPGIPKVSMKAHRQLTVVIKLGTHGIREGWEVIANSHFLPRIQLDSRRKDPPANPIRSHTHR